MFKDDVGRLTSLALATMLCAGSTGFANDWKDKNHDDRVQRDTEPKAWYGHDAAGQVRKLDDLPETFRGNVDVVDEPLTRKEGGEPAWSEAAEIEDVAAFPETLTDRDAQRVPR